LKVFCNFIFKSNLNSSIGWKMRRGTPNFRNEEIKLNYVSDNMSA